MKKRFLLMTFIAIILLAGFLFFKERFMKKDITSLINITKVSDKYMDNYFDDYKELTTKDKENTLIVISRRKIKNNYNAKKIIEGPNHQYFIVFDNKKEKDAAYKELKSKKSIYSVEENITYDLEETEYNSWGIEKMSLDYAINNSRPETLNDVVVAVIDTGCNTELFNRYYPGKLAGTYNVIKNSTEIMSDEGGHGTHVAGTVAEGTPSNVKILPVRVQNYEGKIYNTDLVVGINYVTSNKKADIMNMSLGSYYKSEAIAEAIEAANQENIISVTAAGNNNTDKNNYPSSLDTTISIASVDSELNKSSFSNYGPTITFAAPGSRIKSIMDKNTRTANNNGNSDDDDHETISGTSMASPHGAAAVAILKSYNKDLTLENVIDLLKKTAVDLGEEGWDEYYGYGFISFKDVNFCDGTNCDEYGVYKDENKTITNLELVEVITTEYNYYSITNIMASKFNVYYADGTSEELTLGDLPNLEVLNYSPTKSSKQTVTIKTGDVSLDIKVVNDDVTNEGWDYKTTGNNNDKYLLTGYKDHDLDIKKLYVPENIYNTTVVGFDDNVKFSELGNDFSKYKELYLPSTFTKIGDYSLSNTSIEYVSGDSEGIEIGAHAFEGSNIARMSIPVLKLGEASFKNAYNLYSIDVQGEKDGYYFKLDIPDYAFYNCKKLKQINNLNNEGIHSDYIGNHAFENDKELSKFNISIWGDIGEYAFANAYNLYSVDLINTNSIDKYAFYKSGLSDVNVGSNMTTISESAFEECRNLKNIDVNAERIDKKAFANSNIENIELGSHAEYIAEDAFIYNPINDAKVYGSDVYSSNFSGIYETSTNKLIIGSTNSMGIDSLNIEDNIIELGNYAFTGNPRVKDIIIPENVTKIGNNTFKDCYELSNAYIFGKNVTIGENAFTKTLEGEIANADLMIYVYKDSQAKAEAVSNNLPYRHIEPDEIIIENIDSTYKAKRQFSDDDLIVKLIYHEKEDREEIMSPINYGIQTPLKTGVGYGVGYMAKYQNGSEFLYGDTEFTLKARNKVGYEISKTIPVTIEKREPDYYVPGNLTAYYGQKLSEIELPSGFSWMNENEEIDKLGDVTYKARYVHSDTDNYIPAENIDIPIKVKKKIVNPDITIKDKEYDGSIVIDTNDINVPDLDSSDYTIVSAVSSSSDLGENNATVVIRLTDEKYLGTSFEDGAQEKEFIISFNIVPKKIKKPVKVNKKYIYNGEQITFDIDNYDDAYMNISDNKGIDAGIYPVTISLKNSNYIWDDNTSEDLVLNYEISKAPSPIIDLSQNVTEKYNGNYYSIKVFIDFSDGYFIHYMDDNGEYTLDEQPTYSEIGNYVIKYKVDVDDNHESYYGERTLSITKSSITNNSTDYIGIYDGEYHSINIDVDLENYNILYSVDNTDYNLTEKPKFKDVGEYIVNYVISSDDYDDIIGSNVVKIYGIKETDPSLKIKPYNTFNYTLITNDHSFKALSNKITSYSLISQYNHFDVNNKETDDDLLKTGDMLIININEQANYRYKIAVRGDVNGNGEIDIIDYIRIMKDIMEESKLDGIYYEAADVNDNEEVDIIDYIRIMKIIMEEE